MTTNDNERENKLRASASFKVSDGLNKAVVKCLHLSSSAPCCQGISGYLALLTRQAFSSVPGAAGAGVDSWDLARERKKHFVFPKMHRCQRSSEQNSRSVKHTGILAGS